MTANLRSDLALEARACSACGAVTDNILRDSDGGEYCRACYAALPECHVCGERESTCREVETREGDDGRVIIIQACASCRDMRAWAQGWR